MAVAVRMRSLACVLIIAFAPGLARAQDMMGNVNLSSPTFTEAEMTREEVAALLDAEQPPDLSLRRLNGLDLSGLDFSKVNLRGAYRKTFADRWHEYDILRGKPIKLLHGSETISGTASGIDDEGSLILKTDKGRTERFRAGEVTIDKK